ncbi:hypothetical protein BDF19DRAFT_442453 [Syncephalis fuscata]|nr:hypothetical protein BDF19DRAFT_442453 [Syncephalis fuscata]
MFLATSCNIACSIFIIISTHKVNADAFFIIDYVVVTTILINHCQSFGKSTKLTHRPKTDYILNLSQIATMKSIN